MTRAIVVGSGPNGLASAITLAQHGLDVTVLEAADTIGGGLRSSSSLTIDGLIHDHCAAVHPMALASPFFRGIDLQPYGLEWVWPQIDLAHPLPNGNAAVMVRSITETAEQLGIDGPRWERLLTPIVDRFDDVIGELLHPALQRWPRHATALTHFAALAAMPANILEHLWRTEEAASLFAGNAAHGWQPLNRPGTSAFALMFAAACHRYGWPVAKGGSSTIAAALTGLLESLGGKVETGHHVSDLHELPPTDVVMLDLTPAAIIKLAGPELPQRVRRAYAKYRPAPAAFKLDLAVEGGIPWENVAARRAGTVHVCGSAREVAAAERATNAGVMPARPFVLVAQQYLADPGRSLGNIHPVYAYAHVPHGYGRDASEAMLSQIERFAPGTRDRIISVRKQAPRDLETLNPNLLGGDIIGGANSARQIVFRPRIARTPYLTGIPHTYVCSASTPPGAGVHGMCGHNAALTALEQMGMR